MLDKCHSPFTSGFTFALFGFVVVFLVVFFFFLSHINGWDKGSSRNWFHLTSIFMHVSEGNFFHGTKFPFNFQHICLCIRNTLRCLGHYPLQQQLEATWDFVRCLEWSRIFKSGQPNPELDHLAAKSEITLTQTEAIIFSVQCPASKDGSVTRPEPCGVLLVNADIFNVYACGTWIKLVLALVTFNSQQWSNQHTVNASDPSLLQARRDLPLTSAELFMGATFN